MGEPKTVNNQALTSETREVLGVQGMEEARDSGEQQQTEAQIEADHVVTSRALEIRTG